MEIISHRGNLTGKDTNRENTPSAIYQALRAGYSVEIDIWSEQGKFWLGHDRPETELADYSLLVHPKIYVHAKNIPATTALRSLIGCQWFWHETDAMTITSTGKVWCFPGVHLPNSIVLDLNDHPISAYHVDHTWLGICTDDPSKFVNL